MTATSEKADVRHLRPATVPAVTEMPSLDDRARQEAEVEGVVVPLDPDAPLAEGPEPDVAPRRVLVVVAHPDDADFGAAGTVASWTALGCAVTYCIITDGSAGSVDGATDSSVLSATRQQEQREAAEAVGVEEVVFLGYEDGALEPTRDVRRDVTRVIRQVRPDRVITQSPERDYDRIRASHPDHLAAGEATLRAVYPDARNPYAHRELLEGGLEPFEVPEVWLMAAPRPDRVVDITDHFEKKLAALRSHRSQIADPVAIETFISNWTSATAQRFGLAPGRLAEAFRVIDTR